MLYYYISSDGICLLLQTIQEYKNKSLADTVINISNIYSWQVYVLYKHADSIN